MDLEKQGATDSQRWMRKTWMERDIFRTALFGWCVKSRGGSEHGISDWDQVVQSHKW